mgnify:CR=1 FL=1
MSMRVVAVAVVVLPAGVVADRRFVQPAPRERADPALAKHDVRVQDLARPRVDDGRADGQSEVGVGEPCY